MTTLYRRGGKRCLDVGLASLALMASSPLIAVGAVLVKLSSPGPAFYRARRAGLGGRPFDMLKLRTMRVNTDSADRRITAADDDRITAVGRILRSTKLDELPQLWNVLIGEMSIVGPRPEAVDIVERDYTAEQLRTLEVRPGLTSPAVVRWYPDLTYHDPPPPGVSIQEHFLSRHMPAQLAEGVRYVDGYDVWTDLAVIARTALCIALHSWLPPKRVPLADAPASESPADEPRYEATA